MMRHPPNSPLFPYTPLSRLGRETGPRRISSEEVTRHMLARIEAVDARLHSYVTVMAQQALEDARRADAEIAQGRRRGALHGVPLALKDLLWTRGVQIGRAHV